MRYKIEITDAAKKDIRSLPGNIRHRIRKIINALSENARPVGAKELRGLPEHYRIRVDRWRVIYKVDQEIVVVLILRVRRKTGPETYQDLE